MKRTRLPLDLYEMMPSDMRKYLINNYWHFNKKACEFAVSLLMTENPATKKLEPIEPMTKEAVDEMLQRYGITLENNNGYDYVYVANLGKSDFYKSCVPDEQHLAMYVKDVIDDPDAADGEVMNCWYTKMVRRGEVIDWIDFT